MDEADSERCGRVYIIIHGKECEDGGTVDGGRKWGVMGSISEKKMGLGIR